MKMNDKYYATKPPGTKGGRKVTVPSLTPRRRSAPPASASSARPKHIFDVTHYEDEKMVGVLMSYKAAAVITWLLGECKAGNDTGDWMGKLNAIDPVDDWHGEICSGWVESRSAYDFKDFLED